MLNPIAVPGIFGMHQAVAALQPVLGANRQHIGVSPALEFTVSPLTDAEVLLFDYRGEKVAGFELTHEKLVCLPQAYEKFLKHLVGGLHTVYTKLKRLDIQPRVCNVEQVRALRSLGAIQPGVNRCKLISCKDFDLLYEDCTLISSRPGRPPKRSPPHSVDSQWCGPSKKLRTNVDSGNHRPTCSNSMNDPSNAHMMTQQLFGSLLPYTAHQFFMYQMMTGHQMMLDNVHKNVGQQIESTRRVVSPLSDETSTPLNLTKSNEFVVGDRVTNFEEDRQSDTSSIQRECISPTDNRRSRSSAIVLPPTIDTNWTGDPISTAFNSGQSSTGSNVLRNEDNSMHEMLLNVLGLVEAAVSTARSQQEQVVKDRADFLQQLEKTRAERDKVAADLREEQRMKKIYFKRWCKAKKSKFDTQTQLLNILETQQHQQQLADIPIVHITNERIKIDDGPN